MKNTHDIPSESPNAALPRRTFLKITALTAVGAAGHALLPQGAAAAGGSSPDVRHDGRVFRVDRNGRILVSADAGRTWTVHANFGPTRPVRRLTSSGATIRALVDQRGNPFNLELLPSGAGWHSV